MAESSVAPSGEKSMEEKPSSSTSASLSAEEVQEESKKLIGAGNRHMVMGDVLLAVNAFQEACGLLAKMFGDTADECGEAFFLCGKALLELARMENTVLGNALDGVPEEGDEECEEGEKKDDSKIESADNLDEDEEEEDDDERETTAENKENEEDEVGNLQLAWEMLEVAKVIFRRKRSKEEELQTAQVHLKLGEVSTESGNYSQALEDFLECLTLQLKHLPPHSRLLAETHYQLGLTFGYTTQYSQAIKHFNSSIQVIESCLAMLQEAIDKAEGEAVEERREMEELKKLLPDIREKVEDAKESQKTAAVASEAIHQTLTGSSSGFSAENGGTSVSNAAAEGASSSKSASDISHLVRKKRKPEESPVKNGDAKKAKQEAEVNGSGDTNCGGANGVQDAMEQEGPTQPANPVETSV